ncbi:MAG TPA: hypothetical protein VKU38_15825 [Ktedonobacteraceae bacterium]|nr:hypothetical protein [Ktedonobacteraceae bacterium]
MKNRLAYLFALPLVLCLLVFSGFSYIPAKNPGPHGHCVMGLAPMRPGQKASAILSYNCYATFSNAIAVASGGRTHLPANATPRDLTRAMLLHVASTPGSRNIFGVEFVDANFGGASLTYFTNAGPCSSSMTYGVDSMPPGWNDVISSLYSDLYGCVWTRLWTDNDQSGASQCYSGDTSYVGNVMNDQTSSIYWRPSGPNPC